MRASPVEVLGLDHVVLRVADIDASLAWYRRVLGCTVERTIEGFGLYQLRAGTNLIDLVPVASKAGRPGGGAPGREGVRSAGNAGRSSRAAAARRTPSGQGPGATGTAKQQPVRSPTANSPHPDGHAAGTQARAPRRERSAPAPASENAAPPRTPPARGAAEHKRRQVEARRQQRKLDGLRRRIADLEKRIAEREEAVRRLEAEMAAPGFFTDQASADEAVKRHQKLMWEVGDLMNQWEALEQEAAEQTAAS